VQQQWRRGEILTAVLLTCFLKAQPKSRMLQRHASTVFYPLLQGTTSSANPQARKDPVTEQLSLQLFLHAHIPVGLGNKRISTAPGNPQSPTYYCALHIASVVPILIIIYGCLTAVPSAMPATCNAMQCHDANVHTPDAPAVPAAPHPHHPST
jgi:hypothetical protein